MCPLAKPSRARASSRLPVVAILAIGAAGCSADAGRFGDDPSANPYTAQAAPAQSAPVGRVETQALPPPGPQGNELPPPRPDVTGSVQPGATPPRHNWNWDGGTAITVRSGETLDSLSRKYGVPAAAIMQANGMKGQASLQPGQRLVIPRYNYYSAKPAAPATKVAANGPIAPGTVPANATPRPTPAAANGGVHVVAPGETLTSIARLYGKPRAAIAKANNIPPDTKVRLGQRLVVPGLKVAPAVAAPAAPAAKPAPALAPAPIKTAEVKPPPAAAQKPAQPPAATVHVVHPAPEPTIADASGPTVEPTGHAPSFRWPVRGRIIAPFGPKTTGQQNDGINLAVPEGTSIKAAEDGVGAY